MDAVRWLRGWTNQQAVANEYRDLVYYYKTSAEQTKATERSSGMFSSFAWLKDPSVYRPLRLVTIYYMLTLISCLTPCRPYIVELMYEAGVSDTHSVALVSRLNHRRSLVYNSTLPVVFVLYLGGGHKKKTKKKIKTIHFYQHNFAQCPKHVMSYNYKTTFRLFLNYLTSPTVMLRYHFVIIRIFLSNTFESERFI